MDDHAQYMQYMQYMQYVRKLHNDFREPLYHYTGIGANNTTLHSFEELVQLMHKHFPGEVQRLENSIRSRQNSKR